MSAVRCLVAAFAVVLAGCVHSQISANTNTSVPVRAVPPGTTVTSGAVGLQAQGGGAAAAAVIITGIAISAAASGAAIGTSATPALHPDRKVSEQDCTKPVEGSGNLRCR